MRKLLLGAACLAAATAMLVAAAPRARAVVYTFTYLGTAGTAGQVNVSTSNSSLFRIGDDRDSATVLTAVERGTLAKPGQTPYNVLMMCVDIKHWIAAGTVPGGTSVDALIGGANDITTQDYNYGGVYGTGSKLERAGAVQWIIEQGLYLDKSPGTTSTVSTFNAQVAQLAIWNIMIDGFLGAGQNSNTSGLLLYNGGVAGNVAAVDALMVQAYGHRNDAATLNDYLINTPNNVPNTYWQDFAFKSDNPIPEPAFYQLSSLVLLGGLGFLRRRKK